MPRDPHPLPERWFRVEDRSGAANRSLNGQLRSATFPISRRRSGHSALTLVSEVHQQIGARNSLASADGTVTAGSEWTRFAGKPRCERRLGISTPLGE